MRSRVFLLLTILGMLNVFGQTANVQYTIQDFVSTPQIYRQITLTPLAPYGLNGSTIAVPAARTLVTGTNSIVTFSNVLMGYTYEVDIRGLNNTVSSFTNAFPISLAGTNTVNGSSWVWYYFVSLGPVSVYPYSISNLVTLQQVNLAASNANVQANVYSSTNLIATSNGLYFAIQNGTNTIYTNLFSLMLAAQSTSTNLFGHALFQVTNIVQNSALPATNITGTIIATLSGDGRGLTNLQGSNVVNFQNLTNGLAGPSITNGLVGNSVTNPLASTVSVNALAAIVGTNGINGTNQSFLIGQNATNYSVIVFNLSTNYANTNAAALVAAVSAQLSAGTNSVYTNLSALIYSIGTNATNLTATTSNGLAAIFVNGTNVVATWANGLFATIGQHVSGTNQIWTNAISFFYPTSNPSFFATQSKLDATNSALLADIAATNLAGLIITTNLFNSATNSGGLQFVIATNYANTNAAQLSVNLSNNFAATFLPITNGTAQSLTLAGNLTNGTALLFASGTNFIGVLGEGWGGYLRISAGLWTNLTQPGWTVQLSGGTALERSNGVSIWTSPAGPSTNVWTVAQSSGASPVSWWGCVEQWSGRHGIGYFDNTNATWQWQRDINSFSNYLSTNVFNAPVYGSNVVGAVAISVTSSNLASGTTLSANLQFTNGTAGQIFTRATGTSWGWSNAPAGGGGGISNAIINSFGFGTNTSLVTPSLFSLVNIDAFHGNDPFTGSPGIIQILTEEEDSSFKNNYGSFSIGAYNGFVYGEKYTAVVGGTTNNIREGVTGSAIVGGANNNIGNPTPQVYSGTNSDFSFIAGGQNNLIVGLGFEFAAGDQAQSQFKGSWVWADPQGTTFTDTGTNQFLIRAAGGVGINTNNPHGNSLAINGNVDAGGFSIYGNPIVGGSATNLTPWATNINASGWSLTNVSYLSVTNIILNGVPFAGGGATNAIATLSGSGTNTFLLSPTIGIALTNYDYFPNGQITITGVSNLVNGVYTSDGNTADAIWGKALLSNPPLTPFTPTVPTNLLIAVWTNSSPTNYQILLYRPYTNTLWHWTENSLYVIYSAYNSSGSYTNYFNPRPVGKWGYALSSPTAAFPNSTVSGASIAITTNTSTLNIFSVNRFSPEIIDIPVSTNNLYQASHGFGHQPFLSTWYLVCTNYDSSTGYLPGDRIIAEPMLDRITYVTTFSDSNYVYLSIQLPIVGNETSFLLAPRAGGTATSVQTGAYTNFNFQVEVLP